MDMCKWFFAALLTIKRGLAGQKCGKEIFFQLFWKKYKKKLAEIDI
jgi:hypothetical protein